MTVTQLKIHTGTANFQDKIDYISDLYPEHDEKSIESLLDIYSYDVDAVICTIAGMEVN